VLETPPRDAGGKMPGCVSLGRRDALSERTSCLMISLDHEGTSNASVTGRQASAQAEPSVCLL
jgi:hypothetical protein